MKFLIVAFLCVVPQIYGDSSQALKKCQKSAHGLASRINDMTTWEYDVYSKVQSLLMDLISDVSYEMEAKISSGYYTDIMPKYSGNMKIYEPLMKYSQFFQSDVAEINNWQARVIMEKIERIGRVYGDNGKIDAAKIKLTALNEWVKEACHTYSTFFTDTLASHTDLQEQLKQASDADAIVQILDQPASQRFHFEEFTVNFEIDSVFYDNLDEKVTPLQFYINGFNQLKTEFEAKIQKMREVLEGARTKYLDIVQKRPHLGHQDHHEHQDHQSLAQLEEKVRTIVAAGERALDTEVRKFAKDKQDSVSDFEAAVREDAEIASQVFQPSQMVEPRAAWALYGMFANSAVDNALRSLSSQLHPNHLQHAHTLHHASAHPQNSPHALAPALE